MEARIASVEDKAERGSDAVAGIVDRWHAIRPDLDATPMLVIGRIMRLSALADAALRPTFANTGLANGDFDVLAALRRQDAPHEASPGELANATMVTTGATTKRIDRLEHQGYVARRASTTDGRARVVALTKKGLHVVDELIAVHVENEATLLSALSPAKRTQLARLLGELAYTLEGRAENQ
jgi:DNA-binding MarR family transcriptional regulator